jgi:hypothetical protein
MRRQLRGGGGDVYFVDSRAIFVGSYDDRRCSRVTKIENKRMSWEFEDERCVPTANIYVNIRGWGSACVVGICRGTCRDR